MHVTRVKVCASSLAVPRWALRKSRNRQDLRTQVWASGEGVGQLRGVTSAYMVRLGHIRRRKPSERQAYGDAATVKAAVNAEAWYPPNGRVVGVSGIRNCDKRRRPLLKAV